MTQSLNKEQAKTAMQMVYNARHSAETVNDFLVWLNDNYQFLIEKEKEQIVNAFEAGDTLYYTDVTSDIYYNQTYNQTP